MRVEVTTPPAPVVSWEAADAHLRLSGDTDQQAYVESLIAAATGHIDGPEGWLGRALGVQTLRAYLPAPTVDRVIHIPYPPVVEIISIEARTDGGWSDIDASIYDQRGAEVWRNQGSSWPAWICDPEAVRVEYRAGYQNGIPAAIRAAILLMVGDLFRNPGTVTVASGGLVSVPMSTTVESLLAPFRVYR